MSQSPVRLKNAESDNFSPGGGVTGVNNTLVSAKVQNLGFAKDVALHYAQPDGTWVEKPLGFQRTFGNYDLFAMTDGTFVMNQFVIRYSVGGQTFWDNNGGSNYFVSETQPKYGEWQRRVEHGLGAARHRGWRRICLHYVVG
jgi:hypothetical protein